MRVEVYHRTTFRFSAEALHSIHHLRLDPRPADAQRVLSWSIDAPARLSEWIDGYGNKVRTLAISRPHREVSIAVTGAFDRPEFVPPGDWLRYGGEESLPPLFWLRPSGLAAAGPAISDFAAPSAAAVAADPVAGLHELMGRIGEAVSYTRGYTEVTTTAEQALITGAGVSQDHAHIFIACCRALGVPARYVSGYLRLEEGSRFHSAGHAWAEAWVEKVGWVGFDPANNLSPTADYIKLAIGRDYREAAPVSGFRVGGGDAALTVDIKVHTRADDRAEQ